VTVFEVLWRRWALRRCAKVGRHVEVRGPLHVRGGGRVELEDGVILDASQHPIELKTGPGATLSLGAGTVVFGGASLEAENRITVGQRVRLGPFVKVLDSHFHRVGQLDARPAPGEVTVEDDVVVGEGSILLPGAHLGKGVRVAPKTVIGRRVPDGASVAGNPAKVTPAGG
jgi:acetyltransferase-like isoleucine patch superfamily enzyme